MTRVRRLWQSVGDFPEDLSTFTDAQVRFLRGIEYLWGGGTLWSARQASDWAGLTHRNTRRMMRRLEERGYLRVYK